MVQLFARIDKGPNVNNGNGWKTPVLITGRQDTTTASGLNVTGTYKVDLTTTTPSYAGGYTDTIAELTKANNWSVTFNNLPKVDANGNKIQYLVREIAVYDGEGNDVSDEFGITYDPAPQYPFGDGNYYAYPDMDADVPTVTVTNNGKDSSLVVIKEWKDAQGNAVTENLPEYIKVRLSITKEDGTAVPENLWHLYVQGGAAAKEVYLRKETGYKHTWTVYPTKGIVYSVAEVEVPAGWKNNNTLPVKAVYENGIWVVRLVNVLDTTDIIVYKYDGQSPWAALEGAEFELYLSEGDGVAMNLKKVGGPYTSRAGDGAIFINDIVPYKTYVLVETKAPKGYKPVDPNNPPMAIFSVIVNSAGVYELKLYNPGTSAGGKDTGPQYYQYNPRTLAISMPNERVVYTLPETGGTGTRGYTTAGLMLICMAVLFYIVTNQHTTKQFHTNRFVKK